jgi:hypothetical protein
MNEIIQTTSMWNGILAITGAAHLRLEMSK